MICNEYVLFLHCISCSKYYCKAVMISNSRFKVDMTCSTPDFHLFSRAAAFQHSASKQSVSHAAFLMVFFSFVMKNFFPEEC